MRYTIKVKKLLTILQASILMVIGLALVPTAAKADCVIPTVACYVTLTTGSTATPQYTRIQDGASTLLGSVGNPGFADAQSTVFGGLYTGGLDLAYNGTAWDRVRKDTYAAGPQWVTTGGSSYADVPQSAGPFVVKNSAGRSARWLLLNVGTTNLLCYDNASAASGNIVLAVPSSAALTGQPIDMEIPFNNGLTCNNSTTTPLVLISFW